jgi:hypothetical protein
VLLEDGRSVGLKLTVAPGRPLATLISMTADAAPAASPIAIRLVGQGELPRGAQLTFSIRAGPGLRFTGQESVEIAFADGSASTTVTSANGFVRQDDQVAVVSLEPAKAFNASSFGPLRFRIIQDGAPSDWQRLATLVRLPTLRSLNCPRDPRQSCVLEGSELFLIDAVASDPGLARPVQVPEGFTGGALNVPRPVGGRLYLRLRDDRQVVNQLIIGRTS